MALISCSECNKEVSDKATCCPNCGAPIAKAGETRAAGAPLTTVQETSKKLKFQIVMASLMFWIGVIWFTVEINSITYTTNSANTGVYLIAGGLIWYLVTRFRIWWHHK